MLDFFSWIFQFCRTHVEPGNTYIFFTGDSKAPIGMETLLSFHPEQPINTTEIERHPNGLCRYHCIPGMTPAEMCIMAAGTLFENWWVNVNPPSHKSSDLVDDEGSMERSDSTQHILRAGRGCLPAFPMLSPKATNF